MKLPARTSLGAGLHLAMAALLAVATGFSCAAHPPLGRVPDEVSIDQSKAGSLLSLHRGDKLIVTLPGNPSTGFGWQLATGADPMLVRLGEPIFTRGGKAFGTGGVYRFTFRAAAPGKKAVRFSYRRPFEPGSTAAATFEVTVEVRE